jgi:AraC-like DNA-binding protein
MEVLRAADHDMWSRICSDTFVAVEASIGEDFTGRIDHVPVSSAGFSRVSCDRCRVARTERSIRGDLRDDFLVNIVQEGSGTVTSAGRTHVMPSGTVALCDAARAYTLDFAAPATVLTLRLPRDAVPSLARDRALLPRIVSAEASSATILRHFVTGVLEAAEPGTEVPPSILATAADLLLITLDEQAEAIADSGRLVDHEARYLLIRTYLERHCGDAALTVEIAAHRHGVSRRHVEGLFASHGHSPAAHLRSARLARARTLLARAVPRLPLADIALRSGFNDDTTLIRAFRRTYGTTPDAWRRDHST